MSRIYVGLFLSLLMLNISSLGKQIHFGDVIDATIVILSKCLPKNAEETLLLAGDYNDFLKRSLFNIIPVALIAESKFNALERFTLTRHSYIMYQNYRFIHLLRRLHRFVMVASSLPLLRSVLQRTKDSPWANADGFYILIDRKTEERGCINARPFLWAAWEYDLLSTVFLCIDPEDGIVYYTYNPYSNVTPVSWREVGRSKGRNGHPWIMFKRKYIFDSELCKDLDFDKTVVLNGYQIRLNAIEMEPFVKINLSKEGMDKFEGDNSEVLKTVFHKLQASVRVQVFSGSVYDLGNIGPKGTMEGMLSGVSNGRIDIGMNARSLFVLWKLRYTYPHTKSGLCVITQTRDQISEFTKLITFMSPEIMIGILLICLVTYAIFVKNEGYVRAGLEVMRIVVCVSILHPPRVSSNRIFVCMVFILFLNVNTVFQSHWSSLLTVPIFYHNIDTMPSLKKSEYRLYGPEGLRDFMGDPVLKSRYVTVSYDACKEHVQNSTIAACVGDCYHIYHRISGQDLHKSKTLRELMQTYITREDWPLYVRVNRVIQQMVESGLVRKFRDDSLRKLKFERKMLKAKRKGYKVLLLKHLAFSFYILGIGYSCASIVFLMELMIGGPAARFN